MIIPVISWVFFFLQEIPGQSLPILGLVDDFLLYDTQAKEFHLRHLKDKIFVTDFIFTTCSGICPTLSQNMVNLYRAYQNNDNVRFVSISVNPEYDSPQILADYARRYNADTTKWHFLTGAREKIQSLAVHSFKIGSIEEPIFHSGYFVLVDRKAQIRGYYDGTKPYETTKLIQDIALLLKEKR